MWITTFSVLMLDSWLSPILSKYYDTAYSAAKPKITWNFRSSHFDIHSKNTDTESTVVSAMNYHVEQNHHKMLVNNTLVLCHLTTLYNGQLNGIPQKRLVASTFICKMAAHSICIIWTLISAQSNTPQVVESGSH
jgi:hypothetical protein